MRGFLKIYKMHVHNTVNVYVMLLLRLCGIKVIVKRSLWLQCSAYRFDLSWTTTFTKYSREKGSNTCYYSRFLHLRNVLHDSDMILY